MKSAKYSFFGTDEMLILQTIGVSREAEFVKTAITPYESKTHHAHLIKITGASVDFSEKSDTKPDQSKSGEKVEALDSKTP